MIRKLKQKYKDLKYRYKTTLLMVLAGMLPVVIIVTYMQTGMLKLLKEQETDSMQNSVNQAVDAMENQIQIYENLINYLSYSQDLRNVLSQTGESDYEKYSINRFYGNRKDQYGKNISLKAWLRLC